MQIPNPPTGRPVPDGLPTPADRDRLDAFKAYVERLDDPGSVDTAVDAFNRVYAGTFASREDYGRERAATAVADDLWEFVDDRAFYADLVVGDYLEFVDIEALIDGMTADEVVEYMDTDALVASLTVHDILEYVDFEAFAGSFLAGRCDIVDSDGCVHLFRR